MPFGLLLTIIITALLSLPFVLLYILSRKNPRKPLATTSGTHMSGLPIPGSVMAEIKLYNDKITFEVFSNLMGTKRQEYNLSLEKIVSVRKIVNFKSVQTISQHVGGALITNNQTDDGIIQDVLLIEYLDNGDNKQILISLPLISGVNKFVNAYYKLKPQTRSNQPIEL